MIRSVELSSGRNVKMHLAEDWSEITFTENGERLPGEFEFIQNEFDDNRFLLARTYSPIPRQGLGEAALRFFNEVTDAVVWTRELDGVRRNDGSHLTGDAPVFVGKMQALGLIEAPHEYYPGTMY